MPLELGAAVSHPVTAASSGEEGEQSEAPATTPASPPTPSQSPPPAPLTPPRNLSDGGEISAVGEGTGEAEQDPIAVSHSPADEASLKIFANDSSLIIIKIIS